MLRFLPLFVAALGAVPLLADEPKPVFPGQTEKGFLLPNGWTISPAGKQIVLTDLPLNIIPLTDNKHALVGTAGYNSHRLSVINFSTGEIVAKEQVIQSWFGLAVAKGEDRIWWAGGGADLLHTYTLDSKVLTLKHTGPKEFDPKKLTKEEKEKLKGFKSGLCLSANGKTLYSLDINRGTIAAIDPTSGKATKTEPAGKRPYDVVVGRGGHMLYVSDWADRMVLGIDVETLRVIAKIPVGEHPNQIAVHPKDNRIFVACASSNCVSVIDTKRGIVTETIYTALFPKAPEGSTPDAVAVSPDGKTLFVANADNNCVSVIDIEKENESQVKGFIPTGWYPTAVSVTPDGKNLLVGVGKGNQTKPNPNFKKDEKKDGRKFPYIGTTMEGALSVVPIPDEKALKEYTATVYRNCPYSDKLLTAAPHNEKTAIPTKVGDPSPIKHIIYIIKENRTYDQVFGELKEGNGDPSLVMFGEKVTPNHHKLAREFVLLDNLYCNGQVSRDGHPWSTMAYNTDYIARDWHLTYSGRKGVDDDDDGHLSKGPSGYMWDACARAKLTYRAYGEYGKRVSEPDGSTKMEGRVPGLIGHMCPDYGIPKKKNGKVRDTDRVATFLKEFHDFEKNNNLPRFIIMSLPEDHTFGTATGQNTPQACVASNDLALGRLVEAVSNSKYWEETAIFVIEDDAQNGPDHVDAHRTVGLVISPYTKRKFVDSNQYSTVSMIRTMELILGLSPLSQYDAAARPMFNSFTAKADLTAYKHEPAQINLESINGKLAYGADRSNKMDFREVDRIDDFELNEILWREIKGKDAPIPPAVRRAIAFRSLTAEERKPKELLGQPRDK
jgi:YVTN family beta-propeller protein